MENKKEILENYGVVFTPISFIELSIKFPTIDYNVENNKENGKKIDSIKFKDINIEIGDIFTFKLSKELEVSYKVNNIVESKGDEKHFSLLESTPNNTTLFVVPLIFDSIKNSSVVNYEKGVYSGYLINAFISCLFEKNTKPESIFMLLKFVKSERYKNQEELFKNNPNFVKNIEVDFKHSLYEFTIPEKFKNDFNIILNGNYSKVSKKCKNKILSFYENGLGGSFMNTILNRDPMIIEQYERELDVSMEGIELHSAFSERDVLSKDIL